jgi:hypothetical protein
MRKQFLVVPALFFCIADFAQKNNSSSSSISSGKSSFIAEAGGPGIAFSANYDFRFKETRLGLGARVGLGFVSAYDYYYDPVTGTSYDNGDRSALTFPVQLNYIFGKDNSPHTFEVGGGVTYVSKKLEILNFYDDKRTKVFGTFAFMYRRQPLNGGFSWRAGFTPIFSKNYIQPFGAVSVGYNF